MPVLIEVERPDMERLVDIAEEMGEHHQRVSLGEIEWRGRWLAAQDRDRGVDPVNHVIVVCANKSWGVGQALKRQIDEMVLGMAAFAASIGATRPVATDIIFHLTLKLG